MDLTAIPRTTALGRLLRIPLDLIPDSAALPVLRGPARGLRWVVGSGVHGCWVGSYERPKQEAFAAELSPGMVVWDVGAHAGFYALLAARAVGPEGRVLAVEPLPGNLERLRRHLRLNRVGNVRVVEAAASDRVGTATFRRGVDSYQGRLAGGPEAGGEGTLTVATVTLDGLLDDGTPPPDVLKMDVEGGEAAGLAGATRILEEHRPVLFVATHGDEVHRRVVERLEGAGYGIETVGGSERELLARPRRPLPHSPRQFPSL